MMAYESKIFSIDPEVEKRIHPEALRVLGNWEKVELGMLQTELTAADIDGHLEDNEKAEFQRCMNHIWEGLKTCMDVGDGVTLYNVYIDDIFLAKGIISQFQLTSLVPLFSLKLLLKKACDQKLKKAREKEKREVEEAREKQRREEEEEKRESEKAREEERKQQEKAKAEEKDRQWHDAHEAVNPPLDDAERYLNLPGEYDSFIKAGRGALNVYLEKKEDYLADSRTFDYRRCLWKINYRKEEERRNIAANFAAREYNERLNEEKARLKALLCPNKKDIESYFKKEIKDRRYTGDDFTQFLSSKEKRTFDATIIEIGKGRFHKLVSNDFCEFVDGKFYRCFFLLPSAEFSFKGVPCLDFMFDVFAVVETRVWLKPGQKTFGDYVVKLPWMKEKGCAVLLQEPGFLGYDYVVLTPNDIGGYVSWESIPWVLIKGLMSGELQPAGTTILATSENGRTYGIKNFKEEVMIPRSFENYLKKIGNIEQMVSIGIVGQEVANVIKENLGPSSTEQRTGGFQNGQAVGFIDEELISSLTSLGIPMKVARKLLEFIPKNLTLQEATKLALQKYSEIIAQQHSMESQ